MILDIHSHILPSVDDGAKSLDEALAILSLMKEQGITDVIATPHFYPQLQNLDDFKNKSESAYNMLKKATANTTLPNIYLGCEMLYFEGIGKSTELESFFLGDSRFLLLELPSYRIPDMLFTDLFDLISNGITPIIAHIERYCKARGYKKLISFVKQHNILAQINASSFFAYPYKATVNRLLKQEVVQLIATDSHSLKERPPMLSEALLKIEKSFGQAVCDRLIADNEELFEKIIAKPELKSNTLNVINKGDLTYITFPKLTATGIVRHAFSTRLGGVSKGQYSTMNLSFLNGDSRDNVLENYKILCDDIGVDINHLVLSRQTHTSNVKCVDEKHLKTGVFKDSFSDIDGLITNVPNVALVTQYADCTPLLFCDPVKKVIATSHAGWRGTVKEIGAVTVEKMVSEYGCLAKDIIACIGPCISSCCYEVDTPVYNEFAKLSYLKLNDIFLNIADGKYKLNLVEANRQILINAGIKAENMDISDICTCCNSKLLHSHRATNGKRGNLAAIIELI